MRRARPGEARAFFHEQMAIETDECKVWPFGKNAHGYGQVNLGDVTFRVHVLACEAEHGPRPSGRLAIHGPCHNRACFNGRHLSWGTRRQNELDRHRDGTALMGSQRFGAKLTEVQVALIKRRLRAGERTTALSREFGVANSEISRINTGKKWKHVA